jgi:uncharacterized protein (DUF111 family)
MNPELYSYLEEKLFSLGALDVFKTPIIMKKGRPAVKLSVLVSDAKRQNIISLIFEETTSLGLREFRIGKIMLKRDSSVINTKYGSVTVKTAYINGKSKYKAEFEDCRRLSIENSIPISEIYKEVAKKVENYESSID